MYSNIVIYQYMLVYVCIYAYGIYTYIYIYICLYEYVCCFSSNVVIVLLLDVSYNKSLNATLNTSFYFTGQFLYEADSSDSVTIVTKCLFINIVIYQYMHVYVCIYAYGISAYVYMYICIGMYIASIVML